MKGLIIKTTGSAYGVLMDDGQTLEAHVKGNFRIRGIRSTNPVAVGDRVSVELQADGTCWITGIEDRRNYIIRRSTNLSKQSHILACNIDQAALLVTINHPRTATTFVDRFLATCEAYRVPAVLIFNKVDLYDEADLEELHYMQLLYGNLGYPTYTISAKHLKNELTGLFAGKTTLLSGNSGVGKSTLLNALFGVEKAKTGAISDVHDQGKHTTTFSEMYFLEESGPFPVSDTDILSPEGARNTSSAAPLASEEDKNTSIHSEANTSATSLAPSGERVPKAEKGLTAVIDTPGIRGFGTFDFEKEEVGHYFREIFAKSAECRFSNCTHTGEPGCAVVPAVESGEIAYSRFESYMSLLGDCEEAKYR